MTAASLAAQCESELDGIGATASRIEAAQAGGHLNSSDLEKAVEGLALAAHVTFEGFLRELFYECVAGSSQIRSVASQLKSMNVEDAAALVTSDVRFLDWLPWPATHDRAHIYLANGQPFSRLALRINFQQNLEDLHVVRNRIAHSGEEAKRRYDKRIAQGDASFERPARWLTYSGGRGRASNLNRILASLKPAARVLGADTPDVDSALEPPALASTNQTVPGGVYKCVTCGLRQRLSSLGKLQACSCGTTAGWSLQRLYVR